MQYFCFALMVVLLAGLTQSYPFHASCKLEWDFKALSCDYVHQKFVAQIKAWEGPAGCESGGEKCGYNLTQNTADEIKATHTTPVRNYVDKLTIKFYPPQTGYHLSQLGEVLVFEKAGNGGCKVEGYSTSSVFYAILDFGTNYCNLHNLVVGCGFDKGSYVEDTSDSECTEYSSANCDKY